MESIRSVTETSFKSHHVNTLVIVTRVSDTDKDLASSNFKDIKSVENGQLYTVTYYIDCLTRQELILWAESLEHTIKHLPNKQILRYGQSETDTISSSIGFVVLDPTDEADSQMWDAAVPIMSPVQINLQAEPHLKIDIADSGGKSPVVRAAHGSLVKQMSKLRPIDLSEILESAEEDSSGDEDPTSQSNFPPPHAFLTCLAGSSTSNAVETPFMSPSNVWNQSENVVSPLSLTSAIGTTSELTLSGYIFKKKRGIQRPFAGHSYSSSQSVRFNGVGQSDTPSDTVSNTAGREYPLYFFAQQSLWHARWCVLRGSVLSWYDDEDEYEALKALNVQDIIDIIPEEVRRIKVAPSSHKSKKSKSVRESKAPRGVLGLIRRKKKSLSSFDEDVAESLEELSVSSSPKLRHVSLPLEPFTGTSAALFNGSCTCVWCSYGKAWAASVVEEDGSPQCSQSHNCYLSHPPSNKTSSLTFYWTLVSWYHTALLAWYQENFDPDASQSHPPIPDFLPISPQFFKISQLTAQALNALSTSFNVSLIGSPRASQIPDMPAEDQPSEMIEFQLYPIQIVTKKRNFTFASTSESDFHQWLVALRKALFQSRS